LAVLTNFREDGPVHPEAISRGAIVNLFLTQDVRRNDDTKSFIRKLVDGEYLNGVGGFSLVCGKVGEPMAVISNRSSCIGDCTWTLGKQGQTVGLSNTAFADTSWPKVTKGKRLLSTIIEQDIRRQGTQEEFIEALFELLGDDTLPQSPERQGDWASQINELRRSIFIPALGGRAIPKHGLDGIAHAKSNQALDIEADTAIGAYGTQKQTVILVDHWGRVIFVEKTLYDENGRQAKDDRERRIEFGIEE